MKVVLSYAARLTLLAIGCVTLLGCSLGKDDDGAAAQASIDYDLILNLTDQPLDFRNDVQPVLDRRCVVCHGCYDAPCQLKLSSWEGVSRGASPEKVYDGSRIKAMQPTRLYIDAHSPEQWRALGFSPVLDQSAQTPEARLENSVLYKMLRLKQIHPQPRLGVLPESFDLALDRKQECTARDGFDKFARQHPLWGMPYALPNLSEGEYDRLVTWLAQGAPGPADKQPSAGVRPQLADWEVFLNGASFKERLMSRYLYEHLALAHLHFEGSPNGEFYRLVRSRTPPGEAVDEIPTVRPFDDPGAAPFWYRLLRYQPSIVAKDHVVYAWSQARMQRYRALFLAPEYTVSELPSYDQQQASNPFKTFAPIPPDSRYRFMLDDARYFIDSFIKGPVCRGQVALNVIDDHFWVFFFDPDRDLFTGRPEFLDQNADYLQMPAEFGNQTLKLFAVFTDYSKKQKAYMQAKEQYFSQIHALNMETALSYVWDGNGVNRNAALTVFRHFDSASVEYGLVGDYPDTAWIIDYPLFERIHYLLVAGFDVYGNVGHQLNTRLYMDFLRMEGEDYFLSFLPVSVRKPLRDSWYQRPVSRVTQSLDEPTEWLKTESVVGYRSDDPQRELYRYLERRLGPMAGSIDTLNRCPDGDCPGADPSSPASVVEASLRRLTSLKGKPLLPVPDVSFLRVIMGTDPQSDLAYSLVLNKGYRNLNSIFADEDQRDIDDDTLTVVRGFVGVYPNFYFTVRAEEVEAFSERFAAMRDFNDYDRLVALYGLRRTNPRFWATADWFQDSFVRAQPLEGGILDLNRYRNR